MLYAILAYHEEGIVRSWTKEEDAALMTDLMKVHEKLEKQIGPAARLDYTGQAFTLRGPGLGTVIDGPFAETKEQLLGFYVLESASRAAAIDAVRELKRANPTAVYEIRPIMLYLPGAQVSAPES